MPVIERILGEIGLQAATERFRAEQINEKIAFVWGWQQSATEQDFVSYAMSPAWFRPCRTSSSESQGTSSGLQTRAYRERALLFNSRGSRRSQSACKCCKEERKEVDLDPTSFPGSLIKILVWAGHMPRQNLAPEGVWGK